jgi:hypothetical protein
MKRKTTLEKCIQGWFPKEPNLPSQSSPIQTPTKQKSLLKHKLSILWAVAAIIVVDSFIFLGFSTLQIMLITVTAAFAFSALLFRRTSHHIISKILKYSLAFILVFVVSFNGVGIYLFNTSGYPPTYVPQLTYPDILNASMTQYLQSVEQSASFRLLQAEHLGSVAFGGLILRTSGSGWLMWTFHAEDTNVRITIGQSSGVQYYTDPGYLFHQQSLPQNYPSAQSIRQSFDQIDALGLRWFHDRALEAYQNKTGTKPVITNLGVDIAFNNQDNYEGITILLTAFNSSYDNFGNKVSPTVFRVEFQPNGTLLSTLMS